MLDTNKSGPKMACYAYSQAYFQRLEILTQINHQNKDKLTQQY